MVDQELGESRTSLIALAGVTALAAALRFFNLGGIAFFGDEYSTVASVTGPAVTETSWPFLFLIIRGFCRMVGLSEFTLRFFPALFGVLSIPALFFAGRRVFGERAMLLSGLFITLNHWHLFHSQSGRFYTAVFLFSGLAICGIAQSLRSGRAAPAVWSGLSICVGAGFHPTALWPAIAFAGYCALGILDPEVRATLSRRTVLGFFAPLVLGAACGAVALLDTTKFVTGALADAHFGSGPLHLALSWVRGLELPIAIIAGCWLLGMLVRSRRLGLFALSVAMGPIIALIILDHLTSVRRDYVFAAAPVWFILAGSAVAAVTYETRVPLAARAGIVLAICGVLLPSIISHHSASLTCDNGRAFSYIKEHRGSDDIIYHGFIPMGRYYTGLEDRFLAPGTEQFERQIQEIETMPRTCWLVLQRQRSGLVGNPKLEQWLARHATLSARYEAIRFDYEVKTLLVYRHDPRSELSTALARDSQ